MPAEELSRVIDRELGHQRRPPGAARPEPEALPDQRASSTSWVALHLAAAMERASGREAPLPHPRSLRSSVAMVLGWVLVLVLGVLVGARSVNMLLGPSNVRTLAPYRNHGTAARFRAALPCGRRMIDGKAFLFQSPAQPDHKAFVCLNQKVGSTTWKLALLRAGPHTKFHNLTVGPHSAPAVDECDKYSEDVAVPRFMMVRNPYSRLLSGFMDKCVGQPERALALLPSGFAGDVCASISDPVRAFPAFVAAVIDEDPGRLNGHFSLLSEHCHVDAGYDYYLPTEQMVHWYEPFVAALDLGETVRTGWNVSTKWWHNDGSECFYHPPGLGCDGAPLSTAGAGPLAMGSFHATGSDARLGEFYTPELARAVSEWAKADLEEFGYPAWDGVDGAGYLRRISAPY